MAKKDDTAQMARFYREGMSLKEIGILSGISPQAVQQRLAALGITRGDRPLAYQLIDKEQLESLYAEDLSLEAIAARIGVHLGIIKKALKFHRIPKRKKIRTPGHRMTILGQMEIGDTYIESSNIRRPHIRVYASAKRVGIKVSTKQIGNGKLEIVRID